MKSVFSYLGSAALTKQSLFFDSSFREQQVKQKKETFVVKTSQCQNLEKPPHRLVAFCDGVFGDRMDVM
jgi:hypothetical protein